MSVLTRGRACFAAPVLLCSLLVACGDDDDDGSDGRGDSGVDSGRPDGAVTNLDAGVDSSIDSSVLGPDAAAFLPKVITAQISSGRDGYYGVTYDANGNIYAAGRTEVGTGDSALVIAKYNANGDLQTGFGANGYAIKNVSLSTAGQEQGRAAVIQPSGKIVLAGYAEHEVLGADAGPIANDTDIVLVRFNADGTLDTGFGTAGVVTLNFGSGTPFTNTTTNPADGGVTSTTNLRGGDQVWSLSQTAEGKLVLHGQTRSGEPTADGGVRVDSDFVLARLSAEGVLDTSFSGDGIVTTDFAQTNVSARSATVLANGSIVAAGYSSNTTLAATSKQNPILYKVTSDGTPDDTFAKDLTSDPTLTPGVWHGFARNDQGNGEAYGAALQGDKFVTLGYGPTPNPNGKQTDWVWFRFNADGTQDKSWGNNGETFQDPGTYGDNGHALLTLPDNRVVGVGAGRPKFATEPANLQTSPTDGLIGIVTATGQPDTTFGPGGTQLLDFGGGINDNLWSIGLSPDKKSLAAVGEGNNATATDDRDGIVVIFPAP
jgi:uncharacterized delta-60 repeat protein